MSPSLLRTIVVAARAVKRPRMDLLDTSVLPLRVLPADVDLNLHMNNGRYLTQMDLGRLDLICRTGVAGAAIRHRWRPLVGSATLRFRRAVEGFARYELHTRIACWDTKWFYFEQRFVHGGKDYAIGYVRGLLRGPKGNVSPGEVLAAVGSLQTSPGMPEAIAAWIEADGALGRARAGSRRGA